MHNSKTQTQNVGFDHINRNAPVLIRTPKLTRFEPAQYWGGGPPGNSVVLNPNFWELNLFKIYFEPKKLQKILGSTGTWTRITRIKTLGANQLHYRTNSW